MTTTVSGTFATQPSTQRREGCRTSLVLLLLMVVAVQAVLSSGLWEGAYRSLVLPEASRTAVGYETPPLLAVRDDRIVGLGSPLKSYASAERSGP
jgi:hypothetical protein